MTQAIALADEYWREDALATIIGLSLSGQFNADDFRQAMRPAPSSAMVGAAFRAAQAQGLIEDIGYPKSTSKTRRHGRHLQWRRRVEGDTK